jgi:DeoR family transcriptional regulator, suf operon transcriptional repressor
MERSPSISDSRRSVIDALKRRGEAGVDELAEDLGITPAGVRQHLATLIDEGLVISHEGPRPEAGRGRPRVCYDLSARSEPLFPKAYDELANELLRHAGAEDGTLVTRIFVRRRDGRIANARRRLDAEPTLEAKVAELATILDEDGYLADWEPLDDGRLRLTEHNCAILAVASHHPDACRSEIEFLQAVLPEATVERVSHIVSGAHQCAYEITPRPSPHGMVDQ